MKLSFKILTCLLNLFITTTLSQYQRQSPFKNKVEDTPLISGQFIGDHGNVELELKHIIHFGEPESHIEMKETDNQKSKFQIWNASKDESYIQPTSLNYTALHKFFESGDIQQLQNNKGDDILEVKRGVTVLARMAAHAYNKLPKSPWKDIGPDWKEVEGFGWEKNKVRGYIFSDKAEKNMVIAYKGTSFTFLPGGNDSTSPNDRKSDNLMFSCCCGATNANWRQVCSCSREEKTCNNDCIHRNAKSETTYYHGASLIYDAAKQRYPDANFILVGHSLGGSLASLVAHEKKLFAVTFEAPGERLYARRLGLDIEPIPSKPYVYHFGHNADPIYLGTCNGALSLCYLGGYAMDSKCHTSIKCTFDTVGDLGWSQSIFHHRIIVVINEILDDWVDGYRKISIKCSPNTECDDCKDWAFK